MSSHQICALALSIGLTATAVTAACPSTVDMASSRWTLCRASAVHAAGLSGYDLSMALWEPPAVLVPFCVNGTVPGTVLTALLANGTFPGVVDPWVDDTLLTQLPDISATGASFWSYYWRVDADLGLPCPGVAHLDVRQQTYRTSYFVDGAATRTIETRGPAVGMFTRFTVDLGSAGATGGVHGLAMLVLPPDHPGIANVGQGGSHELAMDVASQYTAAWDWIVGTPDRNTGLMDAIHVATGRPLVTLRDPIGAVTDLVLPANPSQWSVATSLSLTVTVALRNTGATAVSGNLALVVPGINGGSVLSSIPVVIAPGSAWDDVTLPSVTLFNASLWWPHTQGTPALYKNASVTFTPADVSAAASSVVWSLGLRTLSNTIDPAIGARVFYVNSQRVFLMGGNYIAADQFNRRQSDAAFYAAEVRLHAAAGLNLLRLWGGSGGHGAGLAEAADEAGVMLFYEAPMSGDNNGRWAGSYDYPLDHTMYLAAVADTISSLRGHASLLLWCGGNELYPASRSPPPDIAIGLAAIVDRLDTSKRLLAYSSASNWSNFDPEFALAPSDGPYGLRDERDFYQP